jgi:SAM-dependent methyltransferase
MPIRAHIDKLALNFTSGWAWNSETPVACLRVQASVGDEIVGDAIADGYRQDLLKSKIGTGYHAFLLEFTRRLTPGDISKLNIKILDQGDRSYTVALNQVKVNDSELPLPARPRSIGEQVRGLLKANSLYAASPAPDEPLMAPAQLLGTLDLEREVASSGELRPLLDKSALNIDGLIAAMKRDVYPIPSSSNREGYAGGRDLAYWLSGYAQFNMISNYAKANGVEGGRYFDFGGSTGRVFRHFAYQSRKWDVWSCDFKPGSIDYCLKYFPGIRAFCNTSYPSLPIEDRYFNLISALSVFTHINENELNWLLELRRVLAIGGVACITVVNDDCWSNQDHVLAKSIREFRPDLLNVETIPSGKTAIAFRDDDPYYCNVVHSNDYIRNVWGRFFEICSVIPRYAGSQSMVVCRRTD